MTSKCTAATSRRTQQARNCAFAIAAMAVSLSTPATAEPSYYGGVNFAVLEHEFSGGTATSDGFTFSINDTKLDYTALIARLGVQFNENLSAEARYGFGVGDDSFNISATDNNGTTILTTDAEIKNLYGGYIRAGVPTGELYPYLLAGWTKIEAELSIGSVSADSSGSDFSYGFGADLHISDDVGVNVEWVKYYDKNSAEIGGFSIGVVASF